MRYVTNIPLYEIGILCIVLFFKRSAAEPSDAIPGYSEVELGIFKKSAWWVLVSFACYSLTIFLSWINPLWGMAMIPKTIAYLMVL